MLDILTIIWNVFGPITHQSFGSIFCNYLLSQLISFPVGEMRVAGKMRVGKMRASNELIPV